MNAEAKFRALDDGLLASRDLWHPQPFHQVRPAWCDAFPALTEALLALSDEEANDLNDDSAAAGRLLARFIPDLPELTALAEVPEIAGTPIGQHGVHWAWEIPGRKRQQIEAFAGAVSSIHQPVLDWCGGKGHLGRLLALEWQTPVTTLELDATLCAEGRVLAARQAAVQKFIESDALTVSNWPQAGGHAVALHACGNLHRRLLQRGAEGGVARFDVAPCCYHRGVTEYYQPLATGGELLLSRDDTRLAVTETVTASPRLARQRDKEMAWKLGFVACREALSTSTGYRPFKPVPASWFRGSFAEYLGLMLERESLPLLGVAAAAEFERAGWRRQRVLLRLSIVRHAFRRALEIWLALDLVRYLEQQGYTVRLGRFCTRHLTPRNLLISAEQVN